MRDSRNLAGVQKDGPAVETAEDNVIIMCPRRYCWWATADNGVAVLRREG